MTVMLNSTKSGSVSTVAVVRLIAMLGNQQQGHILLLRQRNLKHPGRLFSSKSGGKNVNGFSPRFSPQYNVADNKRSKESSTNEKGNLRKLTDTPRSLASKKNGDAFPSSNSEDGGSGVKKPSNRKNVRKLVETPRGLASAERRVINGSHSTEKSKENSENAAILSTPDESVVPQASHPAHHYIEGGMPSDPSPPPFHLAKYGEESLYSLVLLRHGESEWNSQNRYTGWCDVNLTEQGKNEARTAGRLIHENGIEIDQAFTSVLKRAASSCNMALYASNQHWVPITKTWRLNERHYGALQGYNKDTAWKDLNLDQEVVMQMRRAYDVRPPRMEDDHTYWHGNDRRYAKLTPEQLEASRTESLKDAADRIMPFYDSVIVPSMQAGKTCLIVAHANTIRTLIKHIDQISDEDIKGMTIPTGIPLLYRLDKDMRPVDPQIELEFKYMVNPKGYTWGTSRAHGFHGVYLGNLERLQEIQRKRDVTMRDWQRIILRNIGRSLGWDMETKPDGSLGSCKTVPTSPADPSNVVETRQLWWQVHNKRKEPDYTNMLLLVRMQEALEDLMQNRRKYITKFAYESLINKIHLDTEGSVVEPFVEVSDKNLREERQKLWYDHMALDLEEECLIK